MLRTLLLDGPLVRCQSCRLFYVLTPELTNGPGAVGHRLSESELVASEMQRLAARARQLELVDPQVEEREQRWRELTAAERLADLRRFITSGHLLEVGCSTGELLLAASSSFAVTGVEADVASSQVARARGINCLNGTLPEAHFPDEHFDIVALYHVIEHLPSPRRTMQELFRILRPEGWLVIETPNIATFWFRLLGSRWRQFIPDHRFFFTPETIKRLCLASGFEVVELRSAGKVMSVRLFLNRLSRYNKPLARVLATLSQQLQLDDQTIRLNLGDVMRIYARRIGECRSGELMHRHG